MPVLPWLRSRRAGNALLPLAFVATAVAAVVVSSCARPREPGSIAELLSRLRGAGIDWHVVPLNQGAGDVEQGAYLCESPRRWDELLQPRDPRFAARWGGVVLADGHARTLVADDWGECGLAVGGLVLFGDPRMLEKVQLALSR
jgi:hypothetical protein